MVWNSALETGIIAIDEQHKELFRQADILLDNSKKDRIDATLDFLGLYVIKHFSSEEAMHFRSGYPQAETHQKIHADFVATFKDLRKEYAETGMGPTILTKINKAVVGWLKEHILRDDKDFATFYRRS